MKRYILAGLASALLATSANAAVTLTSVTVNGLKTDGTLSGTVWNTTNDGYYAVFVSPAGGAALNPTDQAINAPIGSGDNIFDLAGEHWALEDTYRITAILSNGVTLTEVYNRPSADFFPSTTAVAGGYKYSLDGFFWNKSGLDSVQAYRNTPTNDKVKADFVGQFAVIQSAVPEPATWALMISGFALVGLGARRKRAGGAGLVQA